MSATGLGGCSSGLGGLGCAAWYQPLAAQATAALGLQVCRGAGYHEHALYVALAAEEPQVYLDILLEDCQRWGFGGRQLCWRRWGSTGPSTGHTAHRYRDSTQPTCTQCIPLRVCCFCACNNRLESVEGLSWTTLLAT